MHKINIVIKITTQLQRNSYNLLACELRNIAFKQGVNYAIAIKIAGDVSFFELVEEGVDWVWWVFFLVPCNIIPAGTRNDDRRNRKKYGI